MKYIRELLIRVLAGESASDILAGMSPQQKGHAGEALLRMLVLLGIHPSDSSSTVVPYQSVPTTRRIEAISTLPERLDILNHGLINAGGSNKIDVCWRDGSLIGMCSSKIGKIQVKSIADLEISAMLTEFTESGGYTERGKPVLRECIVPYVLVDNKHEVLRLAEKSKASNKVSKDNLNPLDIGDLNRMCAVLLERCERCPSQEFESILNHLLSDEKPAIRTRLHQKLICAKVMRLIHSSAKTILIGALPRSGKTYMGAFIAKHFTKTLIITTRPGETRTQWNKVFKEHREFSSYIVRDLDSSSSTEIAVLNKKSDPMIAIASIQFFKMDERDSLIGLDWDIVLLDEVHEGGSTERSNEMLDTYIGTKPIRVMMTATYTKPVDYYSIPAECCCFWDLEDVRLMRRWGDPDVVARLCEKYGVSDVTQARDVCYKSGETDASIRACYENAPRLGILTNMMHSSLYDELRVATASPDNVYGFSMRSLFMPTKDGGAFQNQHAVDTFLALVSGSNKMTHYKKGDMSIFGRIIRYWKDAGHRGCDEFMTQMWFLPSGVGQLLEHVKPAMIARIQANPVLKHFATLTLDSGMGDISKAVASAVVDAKAQGKKGLLLLTGNVGSLGVSLPEVDVAFMLHDVESADMNYQQMMRVLTEMANKKYGIVVDFNIWRVLTTLNTYATSRCGQAEKSSVDRIRWCVSNLVDVDPDLWQCRESPETFPQERIAEELTKQWRRMLEHTGISLNTLARKRVDLGEDQKELDHIVKYMEEGCGKKTKLEVNPDQENLPSGIEQRGGDSDDDKENKKKEDEESVKKANLNDVLARYTPDIARLSGCKLDIVEAMETIYNNPMHREAMNDSIIELYGIKTSDPFNVLCKLTKKNIKKLTDAKEIFEVISSRMSLLDNPQELVAFLGQHLKPKELEKKQNGEVFTPPSLIQQKFDKLTLADPLIWSDPSKKFLDPANGIGNYPALAFQRLMQGLKDAIPDESERKKHILENMLYMCELNKKNVEVSRTIFDPDNVYALNLYQGSYLDLDPYKEWGVEKFDVIFGNPPYQEKVGPRKTNPVWHLFVLKSITHLVESGYLVFIHPPGWRNIDGIFKQTQDKILGLNLMYLEIHDEQDGVSTFKCSIRTDWYILQNKNVSKTNTVIKFQDSTQSTINVKGLGFIPNAQFDKIYSLVAKEDEEQVNVIHDYSSYETRKKWMSKTKTSSKIHPCIYTVNSKHNPTFFYSEKNINHFGTPKLIWSNGAKPGSLIDADGKYGLTQFAYAIVDTPTNLPCIKEVFDTSDFRYLMELCTFGQGHINYKVMKLFRKDAWKAFTNSYTDVEKTTVVNHTTTPVTQREAKDTAQVGYPDYNKMKVAELKQLCKEKQIKGFARKNKAELIALLTEL
jgi:superfamily II DNA or RNA helicase